MISIALALYERSIMSGVTKKQFAVNVWLWLNAHLKSVSEVFDTAMIM